MLLKNAKILNDAFAWQTGDLKIENGRIAALGDRLPDTPDSLDCTGCTVTPGLIDIHTHGADGVDYSLAPSPAELARALRLEARQGVTAVLPSMMTAPEPMLAAALDAMRAYLASPDPDGAWVPGAHLEGPFINPVKCGAQPPEWISAPDVSMLDRLSPDGLVRLMAIAPEMDGAMDCIRALHSRCTLSMGHTAADYDTACAAIAAGASSATHLFNGMAAAAHRAPGVPGAIFDHPDTTAELICDGLHVHPTVVRAAFRLLHGRIALISDSLNLAGRPEGSRGTDAAGHAITIRGGRCELDSGTIAGSCVTLAECVRRAISFGVPDTEAFAAASITPARIVRLDGETGSLTVGKRADVVVWRGAVPVAVFVGGRRISAQ